MRDDEQMAVIALQAGEMAGLETLVRLHQAPAIRTVYAMTRNRSMSEDIVSDAFLAVYDNAASFDHTRPFRPWFYRIVMNKTLKALRKQDREPAAATAVKEPDTDPGPEAAALTRETQSVILGALDRLPAPQRSALILRYYLDMDVHTIAQSLGCSVSAAKWRLWAGRGRLRKLLTDYPDPDVQATAQEEGS